jgi:hypothetical protein
MKVFKGVCLAVVVFFGLIFFVGIVTGLDLEDVSQEKADKNSYKLVKEYYKLSRSSGYLYVNYFRIIENTGDTNLYLDYSEFEISNTSGTILDQTSTFGAPQVIRPGEKGVYQCIRIIRSSKSGQWRCSCRLYGSDVRPEGYRSQGCGNPFGISSRMRRG